LTLFRQLHHEDLYLAVACARGDRIAWELFADEYYASITRLAASACRSLDAGEDLAQELVTGLLGQGVGAAAGRGESPTGADPNARRSGGKLQSYNGRGSLAAWLRAAIAHAAIDRFRRGQKQVSLDALLEDGRLPEADCNPGAGDADAGLDLRWGPVIASALDDEISRLPARDRLLLKLHHLQGVPLKRIGLQFGVHESTASRWLEKIRQGLRSRLERRLRKSHRLLPRDLRFLWNMIGSDAGAAGEPCRAGPAAKDPPAGTCKTGQPDRQSSKGEL
jgi:RNA polymerase sigma-70 factor (ECF subfamily)